MKIKRFYASDMRQALRQVREELGADAVILSNKGVEGGVELVAAMDYDEAAFSRPESQADSKAPTGRSPDGADSPFAAALQAAQASPVSAAARHSRPFKITRPSRQRVPAASPSRPARVLPEASRQPSVTASAPPGETRRVEWSQDPLLREMRREMCELRRMMENELSELTWRDLGRRRPRTQELIRRLLGLGLGAGICRELANRVEDVESADKAWRQALFHLGEELPVLQDDLLDQGGALSLVGPTGVGKTTSIAKLAARFCLRQGNRHLALITTDSYRIGAQEQLYNYGRILDVPVRSATNAQELSAALHGFSDKHLVLIDTAGMGQNDLHLTQRLALLSKGNHPVQTLLTLSATTQRSAIDHAIRAFDVARPMAVVLTKIDESAALGGVFSALMEARLPLAFVTDGQRVPEDLRVARARELVEQALELAQASGQSADEDFMALAYGGVGEHAHL